MERVDYLDFDLQIERDGEQYRAQVLNSPSGQADHTFSLPFSALELENFLLKMGAPRHGIRGGRSAEAEEAKNFGARLFDTVFAGEVHGCLRSSLDQASVAGKGLRLRLRLTDVPELQDLPWEYLYNRNRNLFYALSVETPLVRYLELPERILPLGVTPPLHVLVMIASPKEYPPLDVEREWNKLRDAVRDLEARGLLVLERLEQPTPTALNERLHKGVYHVFHFIGHGGFDPQAQDGVLIMEEDDQSARRVSGESLSVLLHDYRRTLRLVILNACEGGRAARDDSFAGTAQRLIQQGIPAVIAMQFAIVDRTAIVFAQQFYKAIADGFPVDAAVTEARKVISFEVLSPEWGTPVLYMRAPDGHIFDVETLPKSTPSSPSVPELSPPEPPIMSAPPTGLHPVPPAIGSVWQDRQFEAAMPNLAQVGRPTEIRAMIAQAGSEGLRKWLPAFTEHGDLIAKSDVSGRGVVLEFSGAQPDIVCYLELEAPGFQINNPVRELRVLHDRDSGVVTFSLTPTQPRQRAPIMLRLYQDATTKATIDTLTFHVDVAPSDAPTVEINQAGIMWEIMSAMLRAPTGQQPMLTATGEPPSITFVQGDQFVISGDLSGSNVNVKSQLDDVTQMIAVGEPNLPKTAPVHPELPPPPGAAPIPPPPPPEPAPILPPPPEPVEGNVRLGSPFYIERATDAVALDMIRMEGATITIRGPRQIGKSSLLIRVKDAAERAGKRVAYLDFQQFDYAVLRDADMFFQQFCGWIGDELDLENRVDEFWSKPFGNIRRCTRYIEHYLLKELNNPLVLAFDEVDNLFEAGFRSDFFAMLRAWHNDRAQKQAWRQLDIVLVTSTEPYRLIENLNQSPFNVGEVIELRDFTPDQVAELNRRHGAPLADDQVRQLIGLLGGHPYLIRRALTLIAGGRSSAADLLANAAADQGPFDAHLSYYLKQINKQKDLAQGMHQIIASSSCADEQVFDRLQSMGMVYREARVVRPRCRLYADFFKRRLHG